MANDPQISATAWSTLIAANPKLAITIWAKGVIKTIEQQTMFAGLIGADGSGMPIVRKTDLTKGNGDRVVFTTIAGVRGQGVLGGGTLTGNETKIRPGTFEVPVGLLRHATAYTQVETLLRSWNGGGGLMGLVGQMESDWWTRKQDDDIQIRLRNQAQLVSPDTNLYRIGNRVSDAALLSSDTISTTTIEQSKAALVSLGAKPIMEKKAQGMNAPSKKYLLCAPSDVLTPLKSTASFINALENGDVRGDANKRFSGLYPIWDNNILLNHDVCEDDADGRQGSPLEPLARLGTALADATPTTITGGGVSVPAGTQDYFAYFPGFAWKITEAEAVPTDSSTHYAMIYNLTGADAGKYEIFSYTAAGVSASGHQITSVTRGTTSNFNGNAIANAAGRFSAAHPSGSLIIPCTVNGVILGWAIHTGAEALYIAAGKASEGSSAEMAMISNGQDYKTGDDEWHLVGKGVQGVRGMEVYKGVRGLATNFRVIKGARIDSYAKPEPYLG
jgi:N4-gp56 family major capsid protein